MKVLSIDLAAKTGWSLLEKTDGKINLLEYGKFKTKGIKERDRVNDMSSKLFEVIDIMNKEVSGLGTILFEESVVGGQTGMKTLRATFGKRYLLISMIEKSFGWDIRSIKPSVWHKTLPREYKESKIELKVDGMPKIAIGKERKELTLNWVNKTYKINLIWDNERVGCDNDIADSIAQGTAYLCGSDTEFIG